MGLTRDGPAQARSAVVGFGKHGNTKAI